MSAESHSSEKNSPVFDSIEDAADLSDEPLTIHANKHGFHIKAEELVKNRAAIRQIQELRDVLAQEFAQKKKQST
ncbi:MAG: hypothetical protein OXC81_00495, partial [Betaproteobacteria bacterium]|nr:hypothetical protein [Betaproteobacteria bacterium]